MARARNTQFKKFWTAQHILDGYARQFKPKEAERFATKACERVFLVRRYPELRRDVIVQHANRHYENRISLCSYTDYEIAYELARVIFRRRDRGEWAWHGPEFCAIYLDVVQALMGKPARDLLRESFRAHRVRCSPKRKIT